MHRVMAALVTTFCLLQMGSAFAQAPQNDWSPYEEEPSCMVSKNYFTTPDADSQRATAENMILQWQVFGDRFVGNVQPGDLYDFVRCFQTYEGAPDCGLPKNPEVADALWKRLQSRTPIVPGDVAFTYFSTPPPPEAIKFASKTLGRCFGRGSAQFSLEDLELKTVNAPLAICRAVAQRAFSPSDKQGPYMTMEFAKSIGNWGAVVSNLIGFRAVAPGKPVENCAVVPAKVADFLIAATAEAEVENERIRAAAEARRARLANRTDAERFAGLNGCQIAYSLVFQGINSKEGTVGRVPDEAISWALDYEKANLSGEACPTMPLVLSAWVQQQPMATFQAEPDPYISFRTRRGPSENTLASWRSFAKTWMSRYETESVPAGGEHSDCDALLYYARSKAMGPLRNADTGPSAFQTLALLGYSASARTALCEHAPIGMASLGRQAYDGNQMRQQQAREKAARERAFVPAVLPRQNYLWKNAPTTRCYWAGDTKQGQRETCFTN